MLAGRFFGLHPFMPKTWLWTFVRRLFKFLTTSIFTGCYNVVGLYRDLCYWLVVIGLKYFKKIDHIDIKIKKNSWLSTILFVIRKPIYNILYLMILYFIFAKKINIVKYVIYCYLQKLFKNIFIRINMMVQQN